VSRELISQSVGLESGRGLTPYEMLVA
jgi:hypothetical protein